MRLRQRIGQLRQMGPVTFGGVDALDEAIQQYQAHLTAARRFWDAHPR